MLRLVSRPESQPVSHKAFCVRNDLFFQAGVMRKMYQTGLLAMDYEKT